FVSLPPLAAAPLGAPGPAPAVEAAQQLQVVTQMKNSGAIAPELARDSIDRVIARLSPEQCQDLNRLQLETLIHHYMKQSGLTRSEAPEAINAIRRQTPDIIHECIADYLESSPNPLPATCNLEPGDNEPRDNGPDDNLQSDDNLQPEVDPQTGDSPQRIPEPQSQPLSMFSTRGGRAQEPLPAAGQPAPPVIDSPPRD